MYSQSKGRQFQAGEHSGLVAYLRTTCPLDPAQETDQDRKLGVILSKVTQHTQGSFGLHSSGQSFIIESKLLSPKYFAIVSNPRIPFEKQGQ